MPYSDNNFRESNVNYLNKDFSAFKNSLINYSKNYFPNTYKDFNETSPGMMLIEMSAYVGDVMSFYIDQQYKEMMLPLAEERRNIINIAKMVGYKTKPTSPSYVDLTFKQLVPSLYNEGASEKIDYRSSGVFGSGIEVISTFNRNIKFETLQEVDFTISSSGDTDVVSDTNIDGLITEYELTRTVKAISAETKTQKFIINKPTKFMRLTLPENNVIEIISCVDSSNSNWYEVEYLAQDKVPISIPYWEDLDRIQAEGDLEGDAEMAPTEDGNLSGTLMAAEVPYSLEYIQTNKRFITETNDDDTTSLVFGNGLLRNGISLGQEVLNMEQLGVIIPGQTTDLTDEINPMLGDSYDTLGEAPTQTTLTITYRIGGGLSSNVTAGQLTLFTSPTPLAGNNGASMTTVTNLESSVGGKSKETIEEIRQNSKAFFSTQNRCVTRKDYEARVLNLPSKFGSIAKVYVSRALDVSPGGTYGKNLIGNPNMDLGLNNRDRVPTVLMRNINNYLSEFKILTDDISIKDGFVINFGVTFNVTAVRFVNKKEVKLRCINIIKNYFTV